MKTNFFKQLGVSLLLISGVCSSQAFAADKKTTTEKIDVTPTVDNVSSQELAAIYVLSEICPDLTHKNTKFDQAYENLAKSYLNNRTDAVTFLKKQVKNKEFKPILKEARADAKKASDKTNLAICNEVIQYYAK